MRDGNCRGDRVFNSSRGERFGRSFGVVVRGVGNEEKGIVRGKGVGKW